MYRSGQQVKPGGHGLAELAADQEPGTASRLWPYYSVERAGVYQGHVLEVVTGLPDTVHAVGTFLPCYGCGTTAEPGGQAAISAALARSPGSEAQPVAQDMRARWIILACSKATAAPRSSPVSLQIRAPDW